MKKKILCIILIVAMMATLTACGNKDDEKSMLEKIQEKGVLTIATDPAWAPFEYIGADGEVSGVDIDIAKYIADALGVELEIISVNFESISTILQNGEADMSLSAITITDERAETMNFSVPYTIATQYIVVLDSNDSVTSVEDLAGMNIGVHLGTTGDFLVSDEINLEGGVLYGTGATVSQYRALPDAGLELLAGGLDAIVCDTLLAKNIATVNPGLKCFELVYADGSNTIEQLAIAMPKGDDEFVNKINEIIQPLIDNGTIDEYIIKHTDISSAL